MTDEHDNTCGDEHYRWIAENYRGESRILRAMAARSGVHRNDQEDVVQEVIRRFIERRRSLAPGQGPVPWIRRTAQHVIREQRRQYARLVPPMPQDEIEKVDAGKPTPSEAAEDRELFSIVEALVAELEDSLRLVFVLGVYKALPYAEISQLLEIPVGTVKSRMHRAVRRLQKAMDQRGLRRSA